MNDLVAFINARYDEREKIAHAADGARWEAQGGAVWDERNGSVVAGFTRVYPETAIELDEGDARHMALNDPAAVLADIAMKRRILNEHRENPDCPGECMPGFIELAIVEENDGTLREVERFPFPCRTVRLLGSEFDTHPDYQKGWAP